MAREGAFRSKLSPSQTVGRRNRRLYALHPGNSATLLASTGGPRPPPPALPREVRRAYGGVPNPPREPMSTIVKICGLSTEPTLDAALDAGADMVGFNFFPPSPRFVAPERAAALAER